MIRFAVVAVLISSCSRCSAPPPTAPHVKRQTDLRSTLLIIFPEYRGATVTSGEAKLTRVVAGSASEAEALAVKTLEANHFAHSGNGWSRDPYAAQISGNTWVLSVPLDQSVVQRVYMAPTSMSTADLAMWYPREKSVVIEHEVFDFTLKYTTTPEMRAEFLMRQLVRLLMGNGQWRSSPLPDGWDVDGGQPQPFEVQFDELSTKATLRVHREGADVSLHYTLVTDEVQ